MEASSEESRMRNLFGLYIDRIDDFNIVMHGSTEEAMECFDDTKDLIQGRSLRELWLIWQTVTMSMIEHACNGWDEWDFESFVSTMQLSVSYLRMMEDKGIEAIAQKYGFDPDDLD